MMKKQLLSLVTLLCVVWLTPARALAYDFEVGGIYYNITSSSNPLTAQVARYGGYYGVITIPKTVTYNNVTYSVTSIEDYAFWNCSGLTSIKIPASVTSIGRGVFSGCSGLTSMEIPSSVTKIGYRAFGGCSGLTSIVVAAGNPNYDSRENCNAIIETSSNTLLRGCKNTVIPASVTSIEADAFNNCSDLTSIEIPNSVTSIGISAFSGCSGLTSIEIPNSVTSIGWGAFWGCSGLTSIVIPASMTSIGHYAFKLCSGLTSIEISNGVTSIGDGAFSGCSSLTSIEIPNSVPRIGEFVFENCSGLTSVEIPASVTSIGDYAFYKCTALTSIEIPASVTSIGGYAFENCSGLTSITWNAKNIVSFSFYSSNPFYNIRSQITEFIIGDEVTIIPADLCYRMNNLKSVTIPASVTRIGSDAFYGCSGLTKIITRASAPPACGGGTWKNVNQSTCTLYVPTGSKATYAAATGWKDFINIEEFDATEITTLDAETTDTDFSDSEIYTAGGQRVDELQAGMNIVRLKNGKVKKIVKR